MRFETSAHTDVGKRRPHNEDAYLTDLPLVAVADGMGGHSAGEVASKLVLDVLGTWKDRLSGGSPEMLADAVNEANERVWRSGHEDDSLAGMGTTLTAGWVHDAQITLAHVGDSRAYLLRGGELSQLTEDQTVVHQMEKEGKITAEEAVTHPSRHMLLQAIGSQETIEVDVTTVSLQPGDRLLLSSDGLHGLVEDEQITEILMTRTSGEDACRALVDAANESGGDDNITVVVMDALSDEQAAAEPPETQPHPVMVSKPTREGPAPKPWSRRPLLLAAMGLIGLVLVAGVVTLMRSATNQVFIGEQDGRAAIMRGTPGREGEAPRINEVVEVSDHRIERFAPSIRRDLRAGIPVDSVEEAREAIERTLPRVQGPRDTPSPPPPPTATPAETTAPTLPPPSPGS